MLTKLLVILAYSSLAFADGDGDSGVGAAAKLQRAVIKGCIINAAYQPDFDSKKLDGIYPIEDIPFLYISGLTVFKTVFTLQLEGHEMIVQCDRLFPDIAYIHFYDGHPENTVANVEKEIKRLRSDLNLN